MEGIFSWQKRVVPNKIPALTIDGDTTGVSNGRLVLAMRWKEIPGIEGVHYLSTDFMKLIR